MLNVECIFPLLTAVSRFKEDDLKAKSGNIAENLSSIRKMALALLKRDKKTKGGLELRRKKAGWDEEYLLELMGIKSF